MALPEEMVDGPDEDMLALPLAHRADVGDDDLVLPETVPLAQLNQIPAARCEYLVPGLLKEKVIGLVKTLPQKIRSKLVPVPDFAAEFIAAVEPCDKPLVGALIAYILRSRGLNARGWEITVERWLTAVIAPDYRPLEAAALRPFQVELRVSLGRVNVPSCGAIVNGRLRACLWPYFPSPRAVRRYFCRRLVGLSGIVISIRPASRAG